MIFPFQTRVLADTTALETTLKSQGTSYFIFGRSPWRVTLDLPLDVRKHLGNSILEDAGKCLQKRESPSKTLTWKPQSWP